MINETNQPSSNPKEVANLLGRIMSLSEGDRVALASSWKAVDPQTSAFGWAATPGMTSTKSTREAETSPEDLAQDVGRWIESLKTLPPEDRLQELETALELEDDEDVARQLKQAISEVLNGNKMLAAKVALFRYAYEHPFLAIVGVLGLLATVVLIGKGVFFKIF